jgi:hypothetical protein
LREFSRAVPSERNSGIQRSLAASSSMRWAAAGLMTDSHRPPSEAKDFCVGRADVDGQAAGARGGVDEHEALPHALDGQHHAGRGLVVGPGDDVAVGVGLGRRRGAGIGRPDHRVLEERRALGDLGELRAELPEGEVLGAALDQAEGGGVPEARRAAVAEDDLVAVGSAEQVEQPRADAPHEGLDRLLPVRGPHERDAVLGERVELLRADLRGPRAEAAVGGLEVLRDFERLCGGVRHGRRPLDRRWCPGARRMLPPLPGGRFHLEDASRERDGECSEGIRRGAAA